MSELDRIEQAKRAAAGLIPPRCPGSHEYPVTYNLDKTRGVCRECGREYRIVFHDATIPGHRRWPAEAEKRVGV